MRPLARQCRRRTADPNGERQRGTTSREPRAQMTQPLDYRSTPPPPPQTKPRLHLLGWVLFIGLAVMLFLMLNHNRSSYEPLPLSDFRQLLQEQSVLKVTVENDALYGQLVPNNRTKIVNFRTDLPQGTTSSWAFTHWLLDNRGGALVEAHNDTNLVLRILLPLVPWLLIFGFIWFLVIRPLRRVGARNDPMRVVVVGQETQPPPPQAGVA